MILSEKQIENRIKKLIKFSDINKDKEGNIIHLARGRIIRAVFF